MVKKELQRLVDDKAFLQGLHDALSLDTSEEGDINRFVIKTVMNKYDEIVGCVEEGKPYIASYFCCAPELYTAMDCPWWIFLQTPFLGVSAPLLDQDVDGSEGMLGSDLCTVLRLAAYYVEAGISPKPTALISLLHPCDGTTVVHQAIKHGKWRDVPIFAADPPYWEDDRSFKYYVKELKRMVEFITEHTGYTLDIDRLREVCEESNKEYALWQEYNDLRRVVPCPHDWTIGPPQCFAIATYYYPGVPEGTEWFKKMVANAEKRVKAGVSGVPGGERIRVLWFDILPLLWQWDIQPWLEAEWGVNFVMNMFGYTPYEPIDTKNEDTMFMGLAKRALTEMPMIRQARGVADNFLSDIERIVKDYKVDCVVWPGHMGHKDGAANIGMMREKCRDIGVPFLHIGLDLFDKRYSGVDTVKDKFSQFFSSMGLGQK